MMIKIKLNEFIENRPRVGFAVSEAFQKWFKAEDKDGKPAMQAKISYRIGKLIKKLYAEFEIFNDKRNVLVQQFGGEDRSVLKNGVGTWKVEPSLAKKDEEGNPVLNEEGKPVMELNPKFKDFLEALDELLQVEVEIEFEPIDLKEFERALLTGQDMLAIDKFVVVDEKKKK